jgi:hypothetical protein
MSANSGPRIISTQTITNLKRCLRCSGRTRRVLRVFSRAVAAADPNGALESATRLTVLQSWFEEHEEPCQDKNISSGDDQSASIAVLVFGSIFDYSEDVVTQSLRFFLATGSLCQTPEAMRPLTIFFPILHSNQRRQS